MISSRYPIFLAIATDEDSLMDLLRARHEEEGIGPFHADEARGAVNRGIQRDRGVIYVIRGRREIEGSVGLFFSRPQFSTETVLADQWLFIKEPYRKSERAKELVDYAKAASLELRLPLLMSVSITEKTARKEAFYARQLPKAGSTFLFRPEASAA